MVSLAALWIPIVLSAVFVFIASSLIHMILPIHRNDYKQLPDEDKTLAALRAAGLTRGQYVFPHCMPKDMKSPAMVEKYTQGPVGMMTIFPNGPVVLPKFLAQWFLYCLVIAFFTAYLTGHTVPVWASHRQVFRVAGTAAFMAYGLANLSNGIWKGQPWMTVIKEVVDGLIYGLVTAATFASLWPH